MKISLGKEPALLITVAILVGLMFFQLDTEPQALRGQKRGESLELIHHPAPDVERVRPLADGTLGVGRARDLFARPSDTRPLPPLEWIGPPRPALAAIFPPPVPGPAPANYGAFLRRESAAVDVGEDSTAALPAFDDGGLASTLRLKSSDKSDEGSDEEGVRAALRELGKTGDRDRESAEPETPQQRAARVASYRRLYDWIQLGGAITLFGSIENEDHYGLLGRGRSEEQIEFLEINPRTGLAAFGEQGPISYERTRVTDFGLALNRANEIELESRRLRVSAGGAPGILSFAARCIEARHEAPRALETARRLLTELAVVDPDDPAARIGLARCHEAQFDFEAAFVEYEGLLVRFSHRPEVHVALAELELRCLMFDSAETRLREAVRIDRTFWRAHWVLGRLLYSRGEHELALAHLTSANRHAPEDPGYLATRARMRTDLARVHLSRGEVEAAAEQLRLARRLDPLDQENLSALISCAILDPELMGLDPMAIAPDHPEDILVEWLRPVQDVVDEATEGGQALGMRFDLLLALGLWNLEQGELDGARARLLAAAEADPLRAHLAWRSISYLSERSGNRDEALRYIELALDGNPKDAWSVFQRGRLSIDFDELGAARKDFAAALELDLDFDDALVAIGELLFRKGDYEDAQRYLERALTREFDRTEVHTLLGLVQLRLGAFFEALESFRRALELGSLELGSEDPVARGGLAWCTYRTGNAAEALVLFAQLDDSRRRFPEDDEYRRWAREQIERLTDHLHKVAWEDGFSRTVLRNGWQVDEGAGPLVELVDGTTRIMGSFTRTGSARLYREYPAGDFVSIEARLWIASGSSVRAGLFVARERRRQRTWQTESEVTIGRHPDGEMEVRISRSAADEPEILKTDAIEFPTGRWVSVRIERSGTADRPAIDVFLEDIPIVVGAPFAQLGRGGQPLRTGIFVEGTAGRTADLRIDDVVVVFREREQ